ncbi:MAG: ParB N-terminal domain-containing protein, partial [Magnetococcales bacterium]|nr:ParB N-terminal domain-containing protein [Magnetococcales bacterium]
MKVIPAMASAIEVWPVDRLIPYAANARTHSDAQVAKVAASIKEFGFTSPILVDGKDGIIAGHCRLMAARKLGMEQVPVIILDYLSDAQRRAYVLADNKLALEAGWDNDILSAELDRLREGGFYL